MKMTTTRLATLFTCYMESKAAKSLKSIRNLTTKEKERADMKRQEYEKFFPNGPPMDWKDFQLSVNTWTSHGSFLWNTIFPDLVTACNKDGKTEFMLCANIDTVQIHPLTAKLNSFTVAASKRGIL